MSNKENEWINYKTETIVDEVTALRVAKIQAKIRTCPEVYDLIESSFKWENENLGSMINKKIKEGETSVSWLINPLDCSVRDITEEMRDRTSAIMMGITGTKTLRATIKLIENGEELTIRHEEKFEQWSKFFAETGHDGIALFFKNLEDKYRIIMKEYIEIAKNCKKYPMVWYQANKKTVNAYLLKSFLTPSEVTTLQKLVENAETKEKQKVVYDDKMKSHWIKFNASKFPFSNLKTVNFIKNNFKDLNNYSDAGKILADLELLKFDDAFTLTAL